MAGDWVRKGVEKKRSGEVVRRGGQEKSQQWGVIKVFKRGDQERRLVLYRSSRERLGTEVIRDGQVVGQKRS